MELIAAAVCLAVFLALYAFLYRRAQRGGRQPTVQWGWLAAIVGCAVLVLVIGMLSR